MSIFSDSSVESRGLNDMTASLITQTDASGMALHDPRSNQLRANRSSEQFELFRSRQRQYQLSRQIKNKTCASKLCSVFLAICCCICAEDDWPYGKFQIRTLLPPQVSSVRGRKCLILDLDETLVHSSFKPIPNADYIIPVNIDGMVHRVYVLKRPGVDEFLAKLGDLYEIVIFTASVRKYADPLLDLLDVRKVVRGRLFRDSCTCFQGNYVKDLTLLGRDLKSIIIVDNSPASYLFQPENAIGVSTFIDDRTDRELFYCLPFLQSIVDVADVTKQLQTYPDFVGKQVEKHLQES